VRYSTRSLLSVSIVLRNCLGLCCGFVVFVLLSNDLRVGWFLFANMAPKKFTIVSVAACVLALALVVSGNKDERPLTPYEGAPIHKRGTPAESENVPRRPEDSGDIDPELIYYGTGGYRYCNGTSCGYHTYQPTCCGTTCCSVGYNYCNPNNQCVTAYYYNYDDVFTNIDDDDSAYWNCDGSSCTYQGGYTKPTGCCGHDCCYGDDNCCIDGVCGYCNFVFTSIDDDNYDSWYCDDSYCIYQHGFTKPTGCCGTDCCYGDDNCCINGVCGYCTDISSAVKTAVGVIVGAIVGICVLCCIVGFAIWYTVYRAATAKSGAGGVVVASGVGGSTQSPMAPPPPAMEMSYIGQPGAYGSPQPQQPVYYTGAAPPPPAAYGQTGATAVYGSAPPPPAAVYGQADALPR
jgi:hypothetical protein